MMKKVYTPAVKSQVVLEALKDEQTTNEIASAHGIHPKLVREWKGIAVQGLAALYERRDQLAGQAAARNKQVDELYAEIGRLTTQRPWFNKKLGV